MKKRKRFIFKSVVSAVLAASMLMGNISVLADTTASSEEDLTKYVNMRIGSSGDASNTVIGPQRPNASVNPAPDTEPRNNCTGYRADGKIRGFSQIHVSGTGVPKYGQFLISPQIGLSTRLDGHDSDKANENPTASEYSVTLSRYNIDCAFTPAEHSTIYKFNYPASDQASLLIDLAHNLVNRDATDVRVSIETNAAGQTVIYGSGYYEGGEGPSFDPGGWGEGHSLYFYAVINKPAKVTGIYDSAGAKPGVNTLGPVNVANRNAGMGAYLTFDTQADEEIMLKMGVSFKSVDQAKYWMDEEIPAWDYNAVKEETVRQWNEELNKIVIDGNISDTDKQIFYTAQYHSYLMPRDRTDDFEEYGGDMIDDHFAVWDTWRTLYPLYTITKPEIVAKTVNSFITRMETNGCVRDSFVAGKDMIENQGGDDVDNIIAEAYLKGIEGIDWEKAYEVIKKNAEDFRLDWQGWSQLNPGDSYYKSLGYIPSDKVSVSTCAYLVEYAYNDYCAAQIAKGMGDEENYEKWLERSKNWLNAWNPNITDNGYSGYIWPKNSDGSWVSDSGMQTPSSWQGSWVKYFYEASSWNYTYFVPQDIPALIEKMGGENTFCERLWKGIDSGLLDFGNEPAFLTPFLFAYTDKPYLTTDSVTKVRDRFTLDGVPGNDDSGAMSSWYIFSSIGFFPNAGQDSYFFTSPRYPKTTITMANGKTLKLIADNLSDNNKYIQSITINGTPYKSTMFTHDVISNGGEIVFEMGSTPVNYAKDATAEINSVSEIPDSQEINLDDADAEQWAHFTEKNQINRNADAADSAIAPDGLTFTGDEYGASETDEKISGFSWSNGTPTVVCENNRSYVYSSGSINLPVRLNSGDAEVNLYVTGIQRQAQLQVYNSSGEKLAQTALTPAENGRYQKVSLSIGCGVQETFTIQLCADSNSSGAKVGIAAATYDSLTKYTVSFDTLNSNLMPNQTVQKGELIPKPQDPVRLGYSFGGWYKDAELTVPWDFEKDTVESGLTLYAKWDIRQGAFIGDIQSSSVKSINLSNYQDWIHFGSKDTTEMYSDRKDVSREDYYYGTLAPVNDGKLVSEYNASQPFGFNWTKGTPTASSSGMNRSFVWSDAGFELPVTLPAGAYQCDLYLTGIRSMAVIEILNEDGTAAASQKQLWANTKEERQYKTVSLFLNTQEKKSYTIRISVDKSQAEPENYSVGIAAATLLKSVGDVTVLPAENGTTQVRGSSTHQAGTEVTVSAVPDEGYQFTGWEAVSGSVKFQYPLRETTTFIMPANDVVIKANFEKHVVSVKSAETVAEQSTINLSDEDNLDWAYLGYQNRIIQKADARHSVFSGAAKATVGTLSGENMSNTNPNSPYFSWTGGTPTATGNNVRNIIWSGYGLKFDLNFEPGQYETTLYVSSVRAGTVIEVLNEKGTKLMQKKLWDCTNNDRPYYQVKLLFDCDAAKTFTVRYLVDSTDTYADWYSVSLYAASVKQTAEHTHTYADAWTFDDNTHWHACTCQDAADCAQHTFVPVSESQQICSVCGYTRKITKPETPNTDNGTVNGIKKINGKTVLYQNGQLVKGTKIVTVSGKTYAVVNGYVITGRMQTVKISGRLYVVNSSGVVQKGTKNKLIKVTAKKSYVVNKNGAVIKGAKNKLVKAGTKSYIVNKNGIVVKGIKNKLVKVGKKSYIVNKKGIVQKNKKSVKVGKKTYRTNKKGVATGNK